MMTTISAIAVGVTVAMTTMTTGTTGGVGAEHGMTMTTMIGMMTMTATADPDAAAGTMTTMTTGRVFPVGAGIGGTMTTIFGIAADVTGAAMTMTIDFRRASAAGGIEAAARPFRASFEKERCYGYHTADGRVFERAPVRNHR